MSSSNVRTYEISIGGDTIGALPFMEKYTGIIDLLDDGSGRTVIRDANGVVLLVTSKDSTIREIKTYNNEQP